MSRSKYKVPAIPTFEELQARKLPNKVQPRLNSSALTQSGRIRRTHTPPVLSSINEEGSSSTGSTLIDQSGSASGNKFLVPPIPTFEQLHGSGSGSGSGSASTKRSSRTRKRSASLLLNAKVLAEPSRRIEYDHAWEVQAQRVVDHILCKRSAMEEQIEVIYSADAQCHAIGIDRGAAVVCNVCVQGLTAIAASLIYVQHQRLTSTHNSIQLILNGREGQLSVEEGKATDRIACILNYILSALFFPHEIDWSDPSRKESFDLYSWRTRRRSKLTAKKLLITSDKPLEFLYLTEEAKLATAIEEAAAANAAAGHSGTNLSGSGKTNLAVPVFGGGRRRAMSTSAISRPSLTQTFSLSPLPEQVPELDEQKWAEEANLWASSCLVHAFLSNQEETIAVFEKVKSVGDIIEYYRPQLRSQVEREFLGKQEYAKYMTFIDKEWRDLSLVFPFDSSRKWVTELDSTSVSFMKKLSFWFAEIVTAAEEAAEKLAKERAKREKREERRRSRELSRDSLEVPGRGELRKRSRDADDDVEKRDEKRKSHESDERRKSPKPEKRRSRAKKK